METCQGATTQGYVTDWEVRCVVVFEDTHDFSSLVMDLEFCKSDPAWSTCRDYKVDGDFLQDAPTLLTPWTGPRRE